MPHGDSRRDRGSILPNALRSITRTVSQRPRTALLIAVLIAVAAVGWTVTTIRFKTERSDLIDPSAEFHQRWLSYTAEFGDASDVIVVVEAENPETIKRTLNDLGARLEGETELFQSVLYRIQPQEFPRDKGLQYQSPSILARGLVTLNDLQPVLQNRWDGMRLDASFDRLTRDYDIRESNPPGERRRIFARAERLTSSLSDYIEDPSRFASPWPKILPADALSRVTIKETVYFLNKKGTMGFLKAIPKNSGKDFQGASRSIDQLRQIIAEVKKTHPDAKIGVTGIPVLEDDEMNRSRTDMSRAALISFVGVGLLLILGFRGLRHPLLALTMLLFGMAWSFGYTTLVVGHLNILSLSFAVILIGLGIDFAIHFLARYLELRHQGTDLQPALIKTSAGVGAGVVTAAITTAFAFFSASFTQFLGIAELGMIVGGGILLCALATFVVLPALIALADRNVEPKKLPTPFQGNLLRKLTSSFPLPVLLLTAIVIGGIGAQIVKFRDGNFELQTRYDYNLLNLQADGLDSVETQRRVFADADHSLLYAVSIADSPQQARALKAKFEALPTVHHVDELASTLPAAPWEQTKLLLQGYRSLLVSVPEQPPSLPPREPADLGRAMEQFYNRIRLHTEPQVRKVSVRIDAFLDRFEQLSLQQQKSFIRGYQQQMAAALHTQLATLAAMTNPQPVRVEELPRVLTSRFVSSQGKWLLQIYPKDQIWDVEPLKKFVADVRSVDAEVTGTPLQNLEASQQIKSSYKTAALYALAVILLVLLVDFLDRDYTLLALLLPLAIIAFALIVLKTRRIEYDPIWLVASYAAMAVALAAIFDFRNLRDALLAMIPPLAGGLMMFGGLVWLGVNLNPANLIVLPLILGIGVDDGVHVIHDFRAQKSNYRMSPSTMNAIVLTSLTSMIGFGSMMFAAHRGLYSVGLVLVIGIGSCLFVSLVTLPALLTLLSRHSPPATASEEKSPQTKPPGKAKPNATRAA
ncbi:MAG: MMPL family transporter [Planctomycetes bacterium]|nr:MMPL family transporter [Planctomycetota bacterium]